MNNNYKYSYYPDLHKKYKFLCNKTGSDLLNKIDKKVSIILDNIIDKIKKNKLDVKKQLEEGFYIYDKKPSSNKGITWSKKEYNHLGFQYYYIKTKSVQRITETYNLLIRSNNHGLFKKYKNNLNILSLGGGPGFELYACNLFFKKYYKNIKLKLTTIDNTNLWEFSNKIFNINFVKGSFYNKKTLEKYSKINNITIMSYVFYHYFNNDKSKWDLIKYIISNNTDMILINTRSKYMDIFDYLKKNNLYIFKLYYNYKNSVILKDKELINSPKNNMKIPFKNVPF